MNVSSLKRLAALGLFAAGSIAAHSESTLVWQIGKPDKSYSDFAIAGNYQLFSQRFGRDAAVYEIGKSEPTRDWPYIQPGPQDAWAGSQEHPRSIRFLIPSQPQGLFTLRLEFVDVQAGSPPVLRINTGGHEGEFRLRSGAGDASLSNPTAGKAQKIEVAIPAAFFHQGTNDIVLTAADGSWVLYDAVTLLNDPAIDSANPDILGLSVEPTPLLFRQEGQLRRLFNVNVTLSAPTADVTLHVQPSGETIKVPASGMLALGALNREISLPDSSETFEAKITAEAGTHTKSTVLKVSPAIKWKVFVGASAHTDIGYTDLQPKCAERHNQNTDLALDLMEKYPDFKWNLECAWQAENYLAMRTGDKFDRFLRFAKEGRLGVQALYCNILTGLCSPEAGCRLTWFAHSLNQRYGIPYRSAMISDVPTQEASLPMLLAGSGIRYFSSGINNDRAYTFTQLQNQCPCWWEGPDGSRVLMMYASQYAQASQWGLTHSFDASRSRIISQLKNYEARGNYPFDAVWLHGAIGDNDLLNSKMADVVKSWNERYEFPKLILCQNAEFFEYFERHYGDKLPVVRGSAGAYWEDGAGSSAAETTLCRNAQESLANAEKCLAFAHRLKPGLSKYPSTELADAWRNCLLYDEHTWGAHCSISQPDSEFTHGQWKIKAQFAVDAARQSDNLLSRGSKELASLVQTDGRSLIILNPSSWLRTDVLQTKLPEGMAISGPGVTLCDTTDGTLLLVRDVPACGYRTLPLRQAERPTAKPLEGNTIESRFYRITFDPIEGAITSIVDKELKRELVDSKAPHRFNQYLYVAGGKGSRIVMNEHGPEPSLSVSAPAKASLRRERLGDLGERMIVETSATMAPEIVMEVTVWNDLRRVDFVDRISKTETTNKEAVYFAFPFAAQEPVLRYECPDAIVNANKDMLPGACLDWFAMQHFVEIESADAAIAWASPDAPLVCFQDINRGKWQRNLPMKTGSVFAYLMNNYWHTNYKASQGGRNVFRFSITSRAKTDNTASAQFGWSASNPLLAVPSDGVREGALPAGAGSLVEIVEANVLLIAAKKADAGEGLVLRLWEVSGKPTTAHIRLNRLPARSATACNLVEDSQNALAMKDGVIAVPIRGSGLATVLVK